MATVLERAKAHMVFQHPFFASILLRRPLVAVTEPWCPTAAVDQWGQIYYNPKFIENMDVEEVIFLLAHEVMHVVCQHAGRLGHRHQLKWNIAGDAFINDLLKQDGIGKMIEGGIDMPGSKDKTTDQIYNELPPVKCAQCGGEVGDQQQGGGQDGDGGQDGQGQGQQQSKQGQGKSKSKQHKHGKGGQPCQCPGHGQAIGGVGRDLVQKGGPMTADQAKQQEAEMKVAIAQATQTAKMQGKLPGAIGKWAAELIESKVPWYEKLERYMTSFARSESTWAKRNRRYTEHYLPWVGKTPMMGEICLQIDVSGSISEIELRHYAGHMARIIEQCNPSKVHVLYVDTQVQKHLEFVPAQGDEVKLEFYSGGGTDMEAGFRWIAKKLQDVEVIVCLTDGYTDFSTSSPVDVPVVWCVSSQVVPGYGEHVPFSIHEEK